MVDLDAPLEPDLVIEEYKKHVDRTLLRENLKRTVQERLDRLVEFQRLAEEARRAGRQRKVAAENAPDRKTRVRGLRVNHGDRPETSVAGLSHGKMVVGRAKSTDAGWEDALSPIELLNVDEAQLASVCRRYRVVELSVFGSAARGAATETSDVDLLVAFERNAKVTLFTLVDLQSALTEIFRRPVDLVPKEGLKPALRGEVLAQAQTLYAA